VLACVLGFLGVARADGPTPAPGAWPESKVDAWRGHRRLRFTVEGCTAWVVEPKAAAPGKPWTWCMEFPDAFTERTGVPTLLEPSESVAGMMHAMMALNPKSGAHFIDYQGREIPW